MKNKMRITNGQGISTSPDGRNYIGEFKEGEWDGQGILTWSDGNKYVGEWKNGKPWNLTIFDKKGNLIGKVVNGEWIEQ